MLGTSSGTPTRTRNVSGGALRFDDGTVWIIDCGEGTQHRLLASDIRPSRVSAILITHLHGDHCYGLPGLLASLAVHERREPVTVVGPPGIAAWWEATARFSKLRPAYGITVVEWRVGEAVTELTGPASVSCLPLKHRVTSVAFAITEPDRRGKVNADQAKSLGVVGPALGRLVAGETVVLADGTTVEPAQVLGPLRAGRRVVWCGDSADSSALHGIANDCDLLVHECTYAADREAAATEWGHSTTAQVGELAAELKPRQLVLTHFSSRYTVDGDGVGIPELKAEVEERCPGVRVHMANDLDVIPVPFRE